MDIPRNLYDKFDSEFYNDLNVESFNFNLKTFVWQPLKEISHPVPSNECTINIYEAEYEENLNADNLKLSWRRKINCYCSRDH